VELYEQIRREYEFGVGSVIGVARKLGVHRRMVREAVRNAVPAQRKKTERGYGRIINIGSMTTFRGFFEVAAYGASKAAVGSLTKSLAVEWSRHGVTVNAIAPGVFRTDINTHLLDGTERGREFLTRTPMGRFGDVQELVSSAVFLASPSASFITGEILAVYACFTRQLPWS
jgi:NAD(P)-dependent dehydrogenase (short-subunit alcohol dehydrogenase family)